MADDLSIVLGVELDESYDAIKAKIEDLKGGKGNKIQVQIDSKQALAQIKTIKDSISNKSSAKITIDINKSVSNANINAFKTGVVNKFASAPIKMVFDVNKSLSNANIKSYIDQLKQQLQNVSIGLNPTQSGTGKTGGAAAPSGTNVTPTSIPGNLPSASGSTKYWDELQNAVARYADAFDDASAKVSKFKIINDDIYDSQKAIVEFNNAIGETTTVMFRLENILDDDGLPTGFKEWVKIGDQFGATFKDSDKDIEKTLDKLQNFQKQLDIIYSKGFDRTNRLSGSYAKPVEDEYKRIQEIISQAQKDATTSGKLLDASGIRDIDKALSDLSNLRIKQQNTQYQARQLAATDITSQIPILKNDVTILENKLKSLGFSDKFDSQVTALKDSLKTLGKDGGTTIQQFNSQMKQLNSDINKFSSTTRGKGILEANGISEKQIESIKSINKILNTQDNTEGIQKIRSEVNGLLADYQKIQTQLQSNKLGSNRLESLQRQEKELDQQLRTYESIAKNLNGDTKSQQWVAQQEAGIARMKASFEDYQNTVQRTMQLTPELQNRMDALAQVMGKDGAIDVTNWKEINSQFQELKSNISEAFSSFKGDKALEKYTLDVENLENRFARLKDRYNEFLNDNPSKANAELEQRFANVRQMLDNIRPDNVDVVTKAMRNLATATGNVVTPAKSLSQILTQNLGGVGQYLARFVSATYIISKSIGVIKSMVSEVKSLDTSLMELQKVTTLSGDALSEFTDKAYKLGKDVGRTGKDVIDAVTTFSRAGYNLQESTQLAQSALVMTNVGVDIPNTEAAASDMISILKAFDKQADESMEVIDKLYNVANKEPLDFGNITQMLVTAGGTLAQTNTTLEETMGLLTGAFATLRDTSVSNG